MSDRSFLILGSAGQLAREFQAELARRGLRYSAPPKQECDISRPESVERAARECGADTLLNCAGYNAVDAAEDAPELASRINRDAVARLAEVARQRGALLVTYSTDYVFDGTKGELYTEEDRPNPLGEYGRSKLQGEWAVQECLSDYLLFRSSWVYGQGTQNFLYKLRGWACGERVLKLTVDEVSVPTCTPDMVALTLEAMEAGLRGLYHLTNSGYCSRYELGCYYLERLGADNEVEPVPMSSFAAKAKRPGMSAMSNAKLAAALGRAIPHWKDGVDRYVAALV